MSKGYDNVADYIASVQSRGKKKPESSEDEESEDVEDAVAGDPKPGVEESNTDCMDP